MIGYCCSDGLLYRDSALVNASYCLGGRGKKDICREVECDKSLLHHLKWRLISFILFARDFSSVYLVWNNPVQVFVNWQSFLFPGYLLRRVFRGWRMRFRSTLPNVFSAWLDKSGCRFRWLSKLSRLWNVRGNYRFRKRKWIWSRHWSYQSHCSWSVRRLWQRWFSYVHKITRVMALQCRPLEWKKFNSHMIGLAQEV